jgi:uncharacterized damage-inducible protein DinB
LLRDTLHEVYRGPAWHGPSLLATLREVDVATARRRPGRGRNSIWELVLHLAYARYRLLHRLGVITTRFARPLRVAWWPRFPADPSPAQWRQDLALLEDYQAQLLSAIARVPESRLRARRRGQSRSLAAELLGVALHDAYHTGQIRLLLRLRRR